MNEDISQALERPKNVTIALRILWFFLIFGTGVVVALFSLNWDAFYAELVARVTAQKPNISEETLALIRNVVSIVFMAVIVFSVLLSGFLYYKIGKGRNWARIVVLVFAILGIGYQLNAAVRLGLSYSVVEDSLVHAMHGWPPPLMVGIGLLSAIGTAVALVLLFTGKANAWFHAKK